MLVKPKALYQVKLILDYLPKEEYNLIPKEVIDYIENNFEYDEKISIDPIIPLENQGLDDKAYELLDKIIKSVENNRKPYEAEQVSQYVENVEESLEKEKNIKAKILLEEYRKVLEEKDKEINRLRETNNILYKNIKKIPKFIRCFFIKEENIKLLDNVK